MLSVSKAILRLAIYWIGLCYVLDFYNKVADAVLAD